MINLCKTILFRGGFVNVAFLAAQQAVNTIITYDQLIEVASAARRNTIAHLELYFCSLDASTVLFSLFVCVSLGFRQIAHSELIRDFALKTAACCGWKSHKSER